MQIHLSSPLHPLQKCVERGDFLHLQGRIQEFILGAQTKVLNRKLRTKPESRAQSARVSWAKRESRAQSARELRAKLETIHFGAYLKQLFEMTNKMV